MKIINIMASLGLFFLICGLSLTLASPKNAKKPEEKHEEGQIGNGTEVPEVPAVVGLPANTPESELDFNNVRFHEDDKVYYPVGKTAPCKENQRFFAVPDDPKAGRCDCDWYDCSRPLLFDKKSGKCYFAWSRGPCKESEWFTFGKKMIPTCEKNTCKASQTDKVQEPNYIFKDPKDGKCHEAGTQGYCKADERLVIYPMQPIPHCRSSTVCNALSIPPQQLCLQGSRRHQDGFCTFP